MRWADIEVPNRAADVNSQARSACYPQSTFYLMSDDPSIRNHRITRTCFRICSTYRSRSQAPFYPYARSLIANQAEGTFVLLRYLFGGDRPSQTAQLKMSFTRIHGKKLELKHIQGGISTSANRTLACPDHSLPPILHKVCLSPISAYSKGSWGLSV